MKKAKHKIKFQIKQKHKINFKSDKKYRILTTYSQANKKPTPWTVERASVLFSSRW